MNPKPQWIIQADVALKRAARRAREIAAQTHTPLHVIRDGKVVKLMPALEDGLLREDPAVYHIKKP
jgi:hypothetical protein